MVYFYLPFQGYLTDFHAIRFIKHLENVVLYDKDTIKSLARKPVAESNHLIVKNLNVKNQNFPDPELTSISSSEIYLNQVQVTPILY